MDFSSVYESGISKMSKKKYNDAITDFSNVIDNIPTFREEMVIMKINSLINRSGCYLLTNKKEDASNDAAKAIENVVSKKSIDTIKMMNIEEKQRNPLVAALCNALVRKAQIDDSMDKCYDAMITFKDAISILPDPAHVANFEQFLKSCGFPKLSQDDAEMTVFNEIIKSLHDKGFIISKLQEFSNDVVNSKFSNETLTKFSDTNACMIPYAIMTVYVTDPDVIIACLKSLISMSAKHVGTVYGLITDIRDIMIRYDKNSQILSLCLQFLHCSPEFLFKEFEDKSMIDPICSSLSAGITSEAIESAFFILFSIAVTPQDILPIARKDVVDAVLSHQTEGAIKVLSRIAYVPDIADIVFERGALKWILDYIIGDISEEMVVNSLIAISRVLLRLVIRDDLPADSGIELQCKKLFEVVVPIIMKKSRAPDVVSNGFACLALGVDFAVEAARSTRAIQLASLTLAMYTIDSKICSNMVAFLYSASQVGMINDIKESKSSLPTLMNVLGAHPDNRTLVERIAALAMLCGAQNKEQIYVAAVQQFPDSSILRKYAGMLNIKL